MQTDEIDRVIAGLTKAQRDAILFIGNGPYEHGISLFATFWHRPENKGLLQVIRHDLGLTETTPFTGSGIVERLTPLGLAIRNRLKELETRDAG
jgi:hypothetical protein